MGLGGKIKNRYKINREKHKKRKEMKDGEIKKINNKKYCKKIKEKN